MELSSRQIKKQNKESQNNWKISEAYEIILLEVNTVGEILLVWTDGETR